MIVGVVGRQGVRILVTIYAIKTYPLSDVSAPTQRFYAAGAGFPPYTRGPIASIQSVDCITAIRELPDFPFPIGIEVTAESMRRLQKFKVHSVR